MTPWFASTAKVSGRPLTDRIRVRGRLLLPGGKKDPFGALLGRENSDWRLVSLELAPPAEG